MKEILIQRGKTFTLEVRWGVEPWLYKAIEAIDISFGPPRVKVTAHGIPDKWKVAVLRVVSPKQINAKNHPPKDSDFHEIRRIDDDWIEFNGMDATGFSPYTSGGFLMLKTPQDLSSYVGRMDVKDKEGGTVLISSEEDVAPLNVIGVAVDPAAFVITISIEEPDTKALLFKSGVTDLEMVGPTGVVTKLKLCSGKPEDPDPVRVTGEITT